MRRDVTITGNQAFDAIKTDEEKVKSLHAAFAETFRQLRALADDFGLAIVRCEFCNPFNIENVQLITWDENDNWKESADFNLYADGSTSIRLYKADGGAEE